MALSNLFGWTIKEKTRCSLRNGVRRRGPTGGTICGLRNGVRRRGSLGRHGKLFPAGRPVRRRSMQSNPVLQIFHRSRVLADFLSEYAKDFSSAPGNISPSGFS